MPTPHALIVDDNPVNLKIAAALMDKQGRATDTANTGAAAIQQFADQVYDLVLLDIELPDIRGIDVCCDMRQIETRRRPTHAPSTIIFLTAHSPERLRAECLAAGATDILGKPLTREKLSAILDHCHPPSAPNAHDEIDRFLIAADRNQQVDEVGQTSQATRQLMIISLGAEAYGIDLNYLSCVRQNQTIVPIPGMPPHILGIVNIRGDIVAVLDLAALLGNSREIDRSDASIVIAAHDGVTVGFTVDAAEDIVTLPVNAIDPPLPTLEKKHAAFVDGQAMIGDRMVMILNYPHLMQSDALDTAV